MRARRLVLLVLAGLGRQGAAQVDEPLIELGVSGGAVHGGTWQGGWSPGPSLAATLAFEYGPGMVELGLRGYLNEGASEDLPDFTSVHAEAGWGPTISMPAGVRIRPRAHIGMVAFLFDDGEAPGALRNESEFAAGLAARADVAVTRTLRLWIGADGVRVFTGPIEDVLFLEGGLGLTLPAPGWLTRLTR